MTIQLFCSEFEFLGAQPCWFAIYRWRAEENKACMARDVFHTFAVHDDLVFDVTGTDCFRDHQMSILEQAGREIEWGKKLHITSLSLSLWNVNVKQSGRGMDFYKAIGTGKDSLRTSPQCNGERWRAQPIYLSLVLWECRTVHGTFIAFSVHKAIPDSGCFKVLWRT